MAAEIRNELLIAFGRKLRALRVASGLSQSDLASPAAANFSIKTISAKERGVGTHAPEEPFVALYVQRCRDHKLRRGTVPASAYDPRAWETARTRLEDALFEARAPQPDDDADLAGHVEGPGTGPADVPSLAGPTAPAEAAGSGPTGRFRRLADWTPRAFGVQASVGNNRDSSPTTDAGPQYLARAFDQVLGTDLLYGHEVRPRCVALSGWSSVGKTRSAWAAATAVLPPTTLLARPEDARELLDLLAGPVPAGALVFLDDAARHLREPELHEVSVGLKALLQRREPVAVLLTVHPLTLRQLEELTDDPERDARAKLVLRLIERIHDVDEVLHDLTDARQAAKIDPQLRDALEAAADTGRVIPMLTGGPQLVSRLPRLEASTRALVLGATDCRRLGLTEPLNDALLADAAFGHLDPYERARTDGRWLPEALSAASRRVTGQVAALYPVNHTSVYQVQGYDVSPYLVHHRDRHQDAIPPRTWQALHDHVTNADQLILLGHAARSRTVFSWAHRYFTRAGQLGQQDADRALGELMEEVHWTAPDPAPESAPLPSAAPTTRTEARTEELSGIDMVLDELDDFDLGMTNYATIDPLLHDVVPPYTSYEIITNPPTLEISAKYTVEVVPDHPEIIAKLNIGDDWYTWYSALWEDLERHKYGEQQEPCLLSTVLRAFPSDDVWTSLGLIWCLENRADADQPDNLSERRALLERALNAGMATEQVCQRLQVIAAQDEDWNELSRITGFGGDPALREEAALLEKAGQLGRAQQKYTEVCARVGSRMPLINFWWRTGREDEAEAALRQHILAGNRHSLLDLAKHLRQRGRSLEADRLRRSGLEPDGSTSTWTPPPVLR